MEDIGTLDIEDIQLSKPGSWTHAWTSSNSYSASKLMVAMITHKLAIRTLARHQGQQTGHSVVVMSCDPGTVYTKMLTTWMRDDSYTSMPDIYPTIEVQHANQVKVLVETYDSSRHGKYFNGL
jgi:NAD(P)-dependent dehydrogenase (short-subunit alcohol dehydrogenase family)